MSNKSVALFTIHGMGETPKNYHHLFLERIKKQMGENWKRVKFESIYYQDILQFNQTEIFKKMKILTRWDGLRKFVLYNLSDAASVDYRRWEKNSLYHQTQKRIWDTLKKIYKRYDEQKIPVVILAYSLGCHVLSNYIWDSQQKDPSSGVWKYENIKALDKKEKSFLKLKSMSKLITIGCNIPVFVAGYKDIKPFKTLNKNFQWINLYDKDDILGWPLKPLGKEYRELVQDVAINANENLEDLVFKSWNPRSHESYFGDRQVISTVANALSEFI